MAGLAGVQMKLYFGRSSFSKTTRVTWFQTILLDLPAPISGRALLNGLSQRVPEIEWDADHCHMHILLPIEEHQQIRGKFLEDGPNSGLPYHVEPDSNHGIVVCNFMPFDQAISLFNSVIENDVKDRKRSYLTVAEHLWPLFIHFGQHINGSHVWFYNFESQLWEENSTTVDSGITLAKLCRQFLEGPFCRYHEEKRKKCHPDDKVAIGYHKSSVECAIEMTDDFGNGAPQSSLFKQLQYYANMKTRGRCNEINLRFGRVDEWLPFRNGSVHLHSLELRERTKEDYQVYCCEIDWNPSPDPSCLDYVESFLLKIAGGDKDRMLDYLVQAFIIFSGNNNKILFLNIGPTANSKSSLFGLYAMILGKFAVNPPKSIICHPKTSTSTHTGFLSKLAHARLILLDDNLVATDTVNSATIKRLTTPGITELVRDAYSREMIMIALNGTLVLLANPEEIPRGFSSDPAQVRRIRFLLFETRFMSQTAFDALPLEEQTSGHYAVADDGVLQTMATEPYLQALTYLILQLGGQEYRRRCEVDGEPFPPNPQLIAQFFGQEVNDFQEWWQTVAQPTDPLTEQFISLQAICKRYNQDHPRQSETSEKDIKKHIGQLHPTPRIASRKVEGLSKLQCVLDHTFVGTLSRQPSTSQASDDSSSGPTPEQLAKEFEALL